MIPINDNGVITAKIGIPKTSGAKEQQVNLTYAVDRLYQSGWLPTNDSDLECLEDGRRYPSVLNVQREFTCAGLELLIKQNLIFKCYRATWGPVGEAIHEDHPADEHHGTVVASCEREAAVYSLAQLRQAQSEQQLAGVGADSSPSFAQL